jgi:hypothetical protein
MASNLELIERIAPRVTLVSSDSTKSRWNFPHTVTQELIMEALEPLATKRQPPPRKDDWGMKLFYGATRWTTMPGLPRRSGPLRC